ncbi:hypothetical protein JCM10213v2_005709 [Rhodosporidiobolus nylandii]
MPPSSVIDKARSWSESEEAKALMERMEGKPTMTDDTLLCEESDQYRFNHANHDHVPASSASATGYGGDTYGGARWGAGPSPGGTDVTVDGHHWIGKGVGGSSSTGMDAKALRNYGKGESI